MIVYNKNTGKIISRIPDDQDIDTYYYHYPQEFKDNLACLYIDDAPRDLWRYVVKDGRLMKRPQHEIEEIIKYKRVLTEEERLLNKLKPSLEEIKKAENTIEILTLIQEVI